MSLPPRRLDYTNCLHWSTAPHAPNNRRLLLPLTLQGMMEVTAASATASQTPTSTPPLSASAAPAPDTCASTPSRSARLTTTSPGRGQQRARRYFHGGRPPPGRCAENAPLVVGPRSILNQRLLGVHSRTAGGTGVGRIGELLAVFRAAIKYPPVAFLVPVSPEVSPDRTRVSTERGGGGDFDLGCHRSPRELVCVKKATLTCYLDTTEHLFYF